MARILPAATAGPAAVSASHCFETLNILIPELASGFSKTFSHSGCSRLATVYATFRIHLRPSCLYNICRPVISPLFLRSMAHAAEPPTTVPAGFKLHTENTSHILLPDDNQAFLNPVQEFNRDLSVASIRTWADVVNAELKKKWDDKQAKKAQGRAKRQKSACRCVI